MECKIVQKDTSTCSRWGLFLITGTVFCLIVVLLSPSVYLLLKYNSLANELAEQRKILDSLTSKPKTTNEELALPDHRFLQKRNSQPPRSRRRRHRVDALRVAIEFLFNPPIIHLNGFSSRSATAHQIFNRFDIISNQNLGTTVCRNGCFQWPTVSESNLLFEFERSLRGSSNSNIIGIRIIYPGRYFLYSQVVLNGPDTRDNLEPSIGYETVLKDANGNIAVLLQSVITQDDRGRTYSRKKPMDTINQFGIFELQCNDVVLLRPQPNSFDGTFMIVEDRSYFGMKLISPYDMNVGGNRSPC